MTVWPVIESNFCLGKGRQARLEVCEFCVELVLTLLIFIEFVETPIVIIGLRANRKRGLYQAVRNTQKTCRQRG